MSVVHRWHNLPLALALIGVAGLSGLARAQGPSALLASSGMAPSGMANSEGGIESSAPAADTQNDLYVTVGKSVLVDLAQPIKRLSIGAPTIGEVSAISPTEAMVSGKAAGETSLIVWLADGTRQFYNVDVRPNRSDSDGRISGVRRELQLELPGQPITLASDGVNVFLRGNAKDLNSARRAYTIASTLGKVINLLYVDVPAQPTQILLKVKFASIDRKLVNNLCFNLFSLGATNTAGTISTGDCSTPTMSQPSTSGTASTATLANQYQFYLFRADINLGAVINALVQKQLAEVLAEPNLLAEDGRQASFLAGGEFPYPILQSTGGGTAAGITIDYKEFGVRLNFLPTITPRGTIRLQVAPEVSALDYSNGLTLQGFNIPGLTMRRVRTEVELAPGQSFVIGGLLDNRESETFSRVPYLSSIPILGKFFQSIARTKQNTELIVIVTPELVAPMQANTQVPALNYTTPFLPSNSKIPMSTPQTAGNQPPPVTAKQTLPIEKLLESLQPEKLLTIDSTQNNGGATQYNSVSTPAPGASDTPSTSSGPNQ